MPAAILTWQCRAVLFDLDGVLVDSRRCIEAVWRAWAAGKGLDPEPFIRIAHGRKTSETLRLVAPWLDIPAEAAALDRLEETETAGIFPMAGAAALVAGIPATRWGVVTSGTNRIASLRLGAGGIPVPDVFVTADVVRRAKPAPDPYLHAAERLGTPAEDCVAVEDSPTGIAAARAAGMRVIAVLTTHRHDDLLAADVRVTALARLRALPTEGGLSLQIPQP